MSTAAAASASGAVPLPLPVVPLPLLAPALPPSPAVPPAAPLACEDAPGRGAGPATAAAPLARPAGPRGDPSSARTRSAAEAPRGELEDAKAGFASGEVRLGRGAGRVGYVTHVDIVGRRVRRKTGEKVHFCVKCNFPIAVYGRLVACLHAFCLTCAHAESTCFLCESEVVEVERREKLFICGAPGCLLSFQRRKNLLTHIRSCHRKFSPTFQLEQQQQQQYQKKDPTPELLNQEAFSNPMKEESNSQMLNLPNPPNPNSPYSLNQELIPDTIRLQEHSQDPAKAIPLEHGGLGQEEDNRLPPFLGYQQDNTMQYASSEYPSSYGAQNLGNSYQPYYETMGQENYYAPNPSGNYYPPNPSIPHSESTEANGGGQWSGYHPEEYERINSTSAMDNNPTSQYGGSYDPNMNSLYPAGGQYHENGSGFSVANNTGMEDQNERDMGAWRNSNPQNYYSQNPGYGWS